MCRNEFVTSSLRTNMFVGIAVHLSLFCSSSSSSSSSENSYAEPNDNPPEYEATNPPMTKDGHPVMMPQPYAQQYPQPYQQPQHVVVVPPDTSFQTGGVHQQPVIMAGTPVIIVQNNRPIPSIAGILTLAIISCFFSLICGIIAIVFACKFLFIMNTHLGYLEQ